MLSEQGVREVTLLGQNVNSYADASSGGGGGGGPGAGADPFSVYAPGFTSVYKPRRAGAASFAELLDAVAGVDPEMRIRFTSPHPKDFGDDVLQVCACAFIGGAAVASMGAGTGGGRGLREGTEVCERV